MNGRTKGSSGRRKRINLTVDPLLWEQARKACQEQSVSVSDKVNDLLKKIVADHKKTKPND